MKLTKKKLEHLILQEMKNYRPPEFDPRAEKNYPDYANKLSDMYKSDPAQAASLAGSLDEPIDVETPESDEPDEENLSFGIHQFHQESPVTLHGIHVGHIEIYFHTQAKKWFVNYFLMDTGGAFIFNSKNSKQFSNFEEAVKYYNWNAQNDYVENKPLMDRADYGETAARNKLKKSI